MNLRERVPDIQFPAAEFKAALAVMERVGALEAPCCMSLHQREILFNLVRACHFKHVLDIGTYTGYSALNFALAVGQGGRVVTMDVQQHDDPPALWRAADVQCIEYYVCDSLDYLHGAHSSFDLVSIDGWHEDFRVYDEIRAALNKLRPGGLIFLDDVQPFDFEPKPGFDRFYGPARAVARFLDERQDVRFQWITQTSGLLVQR